MIAVRAATVEDLPAILAIYNHTVLHSTATADHHPHTLETRRAWFDARIAAGLPVIVAVDGEASGASRGASREAVPSGMPVLDSTVVGWAALNPWNVRYGYRFTVETSVYVAEGARGRGVGRALLAELVDSARRLGMHAILAGIDSQNTASLELHARFGFVEAARLREAYEKFDRWLDVVYLQLLL